MMESIVLDFQMLLVYIDKPHCYQINSKPFLKPLAKKTAGVPHDIQSLLGRQTSSLIASLSS